MNADQKARLAIRRAIASRAIQSLLDAGLAIEVSDGQEMTLLRSTNHDEIISKMFTGNEDWLYGVKDGRRHGWVNFVYGDVSCFDVIADHTPNITAALGAAIALAKQLRHAPWRTTRVTDEEQRVCLDDGAVVGLT